MITPEQLQALAFALQPVPAAQIKSPEDKEDKLLDHRIIGEYFDREGE
jgi:hypothetical protein